MERDESGTLALLQGHFSAFINPKISQRHGRIVKTTGDGFLAEFSSAVNAVEYAVELQTDMASANAPLATDQRMEFRIGINLGDVICEDGDLFGDAVNIAARLEAIAPPGGICVTASVYEQIKGKLRCTYQELGFHKLKNIIQLVLVYRVDTDQPAGDSISPSTDRLPEPEFRPSVAVLPLVNMNAEQEQVYFSDGITEDIITELARFRSLRVIARSTTFQYRASGIDIKQLGRELDVQYVVEGSVRKVGDRIRITAQLINAATAAHVWAERYDRSIQDIFAIQDEVVRKIVGTIAGRLQLDQTEQVKRKPTTSLVAYDYVLRAADSLRKAYFDSSSYFATGIAHARDLLKRAIELDENYALAHAYLGFSHYVDWCYFADPRDAEAASEYAKRGVTLDPNDGRTHLFYSQACLLKKEYEEALLHVQQAMVLNPHDPEVIASMGVYLDLSGDHHGGIAALKDALELNPAEKGWIVENLGFAYYSAHEYGRAIDSFKSLSNAPHWIHAHLAACYAQTGRLEIARSEASQFLEQHPADRETQRAPDPEFPKMSRALIGYVRLYENPNDFLHWIEGWRKAGLPV
jgi:TolB-like protein/Tfp pilus assembly protein PilF